MTRRGSHREPMPPAAEATAVGAPSASNAAGVAPPEAVPSTLLALGSRLFGTGDGGPGRVPLRVRLLNVLVQRHLRTSAAVIGGLVALVLLLLLVVPTTYSATTTLWVDPAADGALQQADGLLSRYVLQRATSDAVLARAALTLDDPTAPASAESSSEPLSPDSITASGVRGTNVVAITARASSVARAVAVADAVALAAIEQNRAEVIARTKPLEEILRAESARAQNELDQALAQMANERTGPAVESQRLAVVGLQGQAASAARALFDFHVEQERNAAALVVLDRATEARAGSGVPGLLYVALALVSGALAAGALLVLRERLDVRVWSLSTLDAASGSALPAVMLDSVAGLRPPDSLPAGASGDEHATSMLTPLIQSAAPPALGQLYAMLQGRYPEMRAVMVVPVTTEDDASRAVAQGLALAAARSNRSVTLLSSDTADTAAGPVFRELTSAGIRASKAGTQAEIGAAIASMEESDLVILSVPSLREQSVAIAAGRVVPLAVLVATAGETRVAEVAETTRLLEGGGGVAVATVLAAPMG